MRAPFLRLVCSAVASLAAAGCAHGGAAPVADSRLAGERYIDATITLGKSGPAKVEVRVPRGFLPPGKTELVTAFPMLDEGYASKHVTQVVGAERRPFAPEVPVTGLEDVVLRYEVALPVAPDLSDSGLLGTSFETPKGRHLVLMNLLPTLAVRRGFPLRRPGALTLVLPEGWRAVSSVAQEGDRYAVDDWVDLLLGVVEVGQPAEVVSKLGTRFVSGDFDEATLRRLAHIEEQAEPVLDAMLGSRQRLRLVSVHQANEPTTGVYTAGIHQARAISLRTQQRPGDLAQATSSVVLLHELVHAHLPPAPNLPKWIVEGVTDYLAARVAMTLDGLPEERMLGVVINAWNRLGARGVDVGTTGGTVPYAAGTVLGYCLDVRLTKDGSSLASVLARANARAGGRAIENGFWEQEIALASAPAGARLLRSKTEPLDPPAECFAEAGVAPLPPPTDAQLSSAVHRLPQLAALAYGQAPFGLKVSSRQSTWQRLPAGLRPPLDPLADGDLLLAVEGHAVDGLDDLVRVLATTSSGPVRLLVLRAGERLELIAPDRQFPADPPAPKGAK